MDKTFNIDCEAEIETAEGDFHAFPTCLIVGAEWYRGFAETRSDPGEPHGWQVDWVLLATTPEMAVYLGPSTSIKVSVGIGSGYIELPGDYKAGDQIYTTEDGITELCNEWLADMDDGQRDAAAEARAEAAKERQLGESIETFGEWASQFNFSRFGNGYEHD